MAQKKTHGGGPKTPEGKKRSSMNALRHGFAATTVVLSTEDPEEFKEVIDRYVRQFKPETPAEEDLVEELAVCRWRLRRAWNIETEMYELTMSRKINEVAAEFGDVMHKTRTALGFMAIADEYKAFTLLNRYETRAARRFHQIVHDLKILKTQREKENCETNSRAPEPDPQPAAGSSENPPKTPVPIAPRPATPPVAPETIENRPSEPVEAAQNPEDGCPELPKAS